jgi:hypothetical protein
MVNWPTDLEFANTLLVGSPDEIDEPSLVIWQVDFLSGEPAFLAAETL